MTELANDREDLRRKILRAMKTKGLSYRSLSAKVGLCCQRGHDGDQDHYRDEQYAQDTGPTSLRGGLVFFSVLGTTGLSRIWVTSVLPLRRCRQTD
jgi:hypothetical protein